MTRKDLTLKAKQRKRRRLLNQMLKEEMKKLKSLQGGIVLNPILKWVKAFPEMTQDKAE
jgi:hypothetical protein